MKSNWLKWVKGRQDGKYEKKMYFRFGVPGFLGLDIYVLKFEPECLLPAHIDKVKKGRHFRLNFVYKGEGNFECDKTIIRTKRVVLFRPDKHIHSMQNGDTERRVLSIGLNTF
jgi:hypothetical protein